MRTVISVQDIRTSLASIARKAESGETFMVIRNSKPAFMITPVEKPGGGRESAVIYGTKTDKRKPASHPSAVAPANNPLRQDRSIKGARFVADPCSPVDEKDWPEELR